MARAKVDPIEEKRQAVRAKLIFIALVAALVGITHIVMTMQRDSKEEAAVEEVERAPASQRASEQAGEALGATSNSGAELIAKVRDETERASAEVKSTADDVVSETQEKVNKSFTSLVYNTAIKPVIDHIQSLPKEQQDSIKEAICVSPEAEEAGAGGP